MLRTVLSGLVLIGLLHSELWGQQELDVARWLDQDTALLINLIEPAETLRRVRSLEWFSNPRFRKAWQMLSDDRFPILDPDATDDVGARLVELETRLASVDQISLAIHTIDDEQFTWTLFVVANSDSLTSLNNHLVGFDELLKRSITLGSDPGGEKADLERETQSTQGDHTDTESSDVRDLGWCRIGVVENCLVMTNHPLGLEPLRTRGSDANFSSLASARKYQAIALRESGLDHVPGRISIYGNPVRLKFFMPWITEDRWKRYAIGDLPSCGLTMAFADPDQQLNAKTPIVLLDAIAKYTEPAVGYAKLFQQYRPLEIPPLAVDPIELTAFARDETGFAEELARSFEQENGVGAAEEFWKQHFAQTNLDINRDALPRRQAFMEARYIHDEGERDVTEVITMEKVLDHSAAKRYVEGVIEFGTKFQGRAFRQEQEGASPGWVFAGESLQESSGLNGLDRQNHTRIDLINPFHDAYVLTDNWCVQGDLPAVRQQIDLMKSAEGEDYSQKIRDLQDDLRHRFPKCSPPVMISFFTERAWEENLNQIEDQYAYANGTKQNVTLSYSGNEGNTFRLDRLVGEEGSGALQLNGSIVLRALDVTKDNSEDKNHEGSSLGLNMIMEMVTPMPLGERNEDGYRFELHRREDLQKAIEVMLWRSVSESFPRQLLLYSQGEGNFRLIAGVYRDEIEGHEIEGQGTSSSPNK